MSEINTSGGFANDELFITADTKELLKEFDFFKALVQNVLKSRLLITYAVRCDIEKIASGRDEHPDDSKPIDVARRIAKELVLPPSYIYLQPEIVIENKPFNNTSTDKMLKGCQQLMAENYKVVVLSDRLALLVKAILLKVNCCYIKEMKAIAIAAGVNL